MALAAQAQQMPQAIRSRFQSANTIPTMRGNRIWVPVPMISMMRFPNGEKTLCPTSWTAMSRKTSTGTWTFFTMANHP